MTEQKPSSDMFDMYGEWMRASEEAWNQALNKSLGTEAFAQALGKAMDNYLMTQKTFARTAREYTEQALRTMNIASSADITRLAEMVVNLENKVDGLADELTDAGIRRKLDEIAVKLQKVENGLNKVQASNKPARK